jgi:hypothetical protein
LTCEGPQVPVIAVFTKYDQFKRDVKIKLEDQHPDAANLDAEAEAQRIFDEHFLSTLQESPFVRLESEDFLPS